MFTTFEAKIHFMKKIFDSFSAKVTSAAGSPAAFILSFVVVIVWACCGPIFHYSDTWQLVINTGTTVITFLMVFVIQQSQNKDTKAMHIKLNELIACSEIASNRLVAVEDLTADEIEVLKKYYTQLAKLSKEEKNIHTSHSIDEAEDNHEEKVRRQRRR